MIHKVKRISFELSNCCNMAHIHKKCPVSLHEGNPQFLPLKVINKVFDYLQSDGWHGTIAFHTYNEPTIDPRLFLLIQKAKNINCQVFISSNGRFFNQTLLDELAEIEVNEVLITCYDTIEFDRLNKLSNSTMPYIVGLRQLDDRMTFYEKQVNDNKKPCNILNDIIIGYNGDVCLCCLDYRKQYSFGNLFNSDLLSILKSDKFSYIYENLMNGNRINDLCKRCNWSR